MPSVPECAIKQPTECSEGELEAFFELVASAGKVSTLRLRERLREARSLAFLRLEGSLVGVAGLKHPNPHYRAGVSEKSGEALDASIYAFELGWVSVAPAVVGGKSFALCEPLVAEAASKGVFATTGTENGRMQTTLGKLGFVRVGKEWKSKEADEILCLFVKAGA